MVDPAQATDELSYQDGPFTTLDELFASNPLGAYDFTVVDGEGTKTVTVNWTSTIPQDAEGARPMLTVDFPQSGALSCNTPDVSYKTNCVNCDDLDIEIFDVATDGDTLSIGPLLGGGNFPNPVPYDMIGGKSGPLPDDTNAGYQLEMLIGSIDEVFDVFTTGPADSFVFFQEISIGASPVFTVANVTADVEELVIASVLENGTWNFVVEVEGQNLCSVMIDPPGASAPVYLSNTGMGSLDYEEPVDPVYENYLAAYPTGMYGIAVNQTITGAVNWAPLQLEGAGGEEPSLNVTSPADGSVNQSPEPSVAFSLDCPNCPRLQSFIFDLGTDGNTVDHGFSDVSPPFSSPVAYSAFDEFDTPTPLPNDLYGLEMIAGLEADSIETLSGSDSFDYKVETGVGYLGTFTVPEPGAAIAGLAAIATLVALRRRSAFR